jgi:tetratricopeptide (TPR) repeat protein
LLLYALPFPAASAAAETDTSSCFAKPACQVLFQQAQEQSGMGHLGEAAQLYKTAYDVSADPVLLFNIARVLHKQGQSKEAASYYRQYLSSPIDNAEQKAKAREYLDQLPPTEDVPPPNQPVPDSTAASRQAAPLGTNQLGQTGDATARLEPLPLSPGAGLRMDAATASAPIYKKWWLWTLVGGAVAAGVVGLSVGFASRSNVSSLPQGINKYQPSF